METGSEKVQKNQLRSKMVDEHDLFRGSRLKVKWANHHIATLKDTLNAFMQTDFYRVRIEEDVELKGSKCDPPVDSVEVEVTQDLPSEIPLIIGDVVHNLRSALDLAMCESVQEFGGTLHRHTHFPIRETRQEVVSAVKKGAVDGVPVDFITFLIECIQPYRGGNDTLYTVHDLAVRDKHRMIIPTFTLSPLILTEGGRKTGPDVLGHSILITPRRGEVKKQFIFSGMKLQDNYKPVVFVFLEDFAHGFPREDVFGTLRRLERCVIDTVEALAREYHVLRNRALLW
jgi:hypothetical protein